MCDEAYMDDIDSDPFNDVEDLDGNDYDEKQFDLRKYLIKYEVQASKPPNHAHYSFRISKMFIL